MWNEMVLDTQTQYFWMHHGLSYSEMKVEMRVKIIYYRYHVSLLTIFEDYQLWTIHHFHLH